MEFLALLDFLSTQPELAALFATFSVGATQITKEQFSTLNKTGVRLLSLGYFIGAVVIHYLAPQGFQVLFDLIAAGVGTTGTVGFIKEMKKPA